jgi:hypothetical protein
MFTVTHSQQQTLALASFARKLHSFVAGLDAVEPISLQGLACLVNTWHSPMQRNGFDSEADFALYLVARLCFPVRAQTGEFERLIEDPALSLPEKRYQLTAELAVVEGLSFGALEANV